MDNNIIDTKENFSGLFQENTGRINHDSADFLNEIRDDAFTNFSEVGFPTRKTEKYKYLDIKPFFSKDYTASFSLEEEQLGLKELFKCDIPDINTYVVLLVNGRYVQKNTSEIQWPENVTVSSLKDAAKTHPEIIKKHFNKYATEKSEGLLSLNSLFVQNGIFIHIPKGVVLDKPLQIINITSGHSDIFVNIRNLFVVEDLAEAKLVVCDHTQHMFNYLNNVVSEVYVGEGAHLEIDRIQNENNNSTHFSHLYAHQTSNSKLTVNNMSLHGGLIRNNVDVKLHGEGAESNVLGLFFTDKQQHIDNFTNIEHIAPNCTSTQLFKGVLDDQATGAFNGKIHVHRNAQKTLAYQTNNNILLTDTAKMNTKPQLEIYADDVKCSHGATVGQLDEKALFYLRARGINLIEAKFLMMYAFADEIIKYISIEPLQFRIHELVDKRLRGELSICHNCNLQVQ